GRRESRRAAAGCVRRAGSHAVWAQPRSHRGTGTLATEPLGVYPRELCVSVALWRSVSVFPPLCRDRRVTQKSAPMPHQPRNAIHSFRVKLLGTNVNAFIATMSRLTVAPAHANPTPSA